MKSSQLKKSSEFAEFLGWHLGDGCISISNSRNQYFLTGDLKEEQEFYNKIIIPLFNKLFYKHLKKKAFLRKYASNGVCGIYIFEKKFINLLIKDLNLTYGKKLNNNIPKYIKTKEQKINLLRGFFDTDGSIYFCKSNYKTKKTSMHSIFHYKPKIKVATISKNLISDIYKLLISLGYSPRLRKPRKQKPTESMMHGVVLDTKKDIKKYLSEVGFRNIKHKTKVKVAKKYGFCPPHTTLSQRIKMINNELNPLSYYNNSNFKSLKLIKSKLNNWV